MIYQAGASPRGVAVRRRERRGDLRRGRRRRRMLTRDGDARSATRSRRPAATRTRRRSTRCPRSSPTQHRRGGAGQARGVPVLRATPRARWSSCPAGWASTCRQYDLDEPIGNVESNAIQSAVAAFQEPRTPTAASGRCATSPTGASIGGLGPAVRRLRCERRRPAAGVGRGDRRRRVQPRLRDHAGIVRGHRRPRGAGAAGARCLPDGLRAGTLRNKLLGKGDRLPDEHRGARYRLGGDLSTRTDRYRAYTNT